MTRVNRWPSAVSVVVFVVGLAGSVAAGIVTYRTVGAYGGPVRTGYHREWNPQTRRYQLVHESTTKGGLRIRQLLTDYMQVQQTDLSGEGVGAAIEQAADRSGGARIPFSTRNDGVIDAWAIRDSKSQTSRVEMSTKRDGRIDRWERYVEGQLVRVDLDTDGNGKPDKWMTYEEGILMDTFIDANEDGRADGPPTP